MERPKRKFTKEDAIYGIWADNSSDEDDLDTKRSKAAGEPDRVVSFVGAGLGGGAGGDWLSADDGVEYQQRGGLGSKERSRNVPQHDVDYENDAAPQQRGGLGSKQRGGKHQKNQQQQHDAEFGNFEQHTKGIGAKLLAKYGYVHGQGLGKEGAGISAPIAVKVRPQKMGFGYGNFQEAKGVVGEQEEAAAAAAEEETKSAFKYSKRKTKPSMDAPAGVRSDDEDEAPRWKKSAAANARSKRVYKTVEELRAENDTKGVGATYADKIVDMTGPQARVVDSVTEALEQQAAAQASEAALVATSRSLPELQYNVKLLADMASSALINTDRRVKQDATTVASLKHANSQLSARVNADTAYLQRVEEITDMLEKLQERINSRTASIPLSDLTSMFTLLQTKYAQEYQLHQLADLAGALVFPLLKKQLADWHPLESPASGADIVGQWRKLLQQVRPQDGINPLLERAGAVPQSDIYEQMIIQVVLPRIRFVATNDWNPRESQRFTKFLDLWAGYLPAPVLENVYSQLIVPKLTREAEAWNPRVDSVPVHTWVLPWLKYLGPKRLANVLLGIRFKLASVLSDWNVVDPSAHAMLSAWKNVFDKASMDAILIRQILPKIAVALHAFVVDPRDQQFDVFEAVVVWHDLLSEQHFFTMLEHEFWPKWFKMLHSWLLSSPDYDEITAWYMDWKQRFPAAVLANERTKIQFAKALQVMNQALSGEEDIAIPDATVVLPPKPAASLSAKPSEAARMSFRDVVEQMAAQNDLTFLPTDKRRHPSGKQVFQCGKAFIFIDQTLVYIWDNGDWRPTSVDNLMEVAR
eukprot:TRINITY_DN15243_c0_g1_i1.p1 TRINITY_DN15243_c0_g1~~TRINITY_DN15243_c0_g1_i1.p1  ORF type:complete len:834 (-),score=217.77 TRINITY_DN15243_c0_g1_i1:33-2465(-)